MLEVFALSVLQGVAEFLPVSSSGHLAIGQKLLGLGEPGMRLEVCLHAGTLISIFLYYRRRIAAIASGCFMPSAAPAERRESWLFAAKLLASALPAVAVYFSFKDAIEAMFSNLAMVGALLMFTGAVLVGTRYMPRGERGITFPRAVFMGIGQAVALLPGVSRSGMTLACARAGRADPAKSAEFSFLMSSPLIAGALALEVAKCFSKSAPAAPDSVCWPLMAFGMAVSAAVGYVSLALLVKSLKGRWFWLFGPYCVLAGLLTLVLAWSAGG